MAMSSFAAALTGTSYNNIGPATAAMSAFTTAAVGSEQNNVGTATAAMSAFTTAAVGTYTAPWSPTTVSGCKLWLKSDTGVTQVANLVSAWADQSGNGNNLAEAVVKPTYAATGAPGTNGPVISTVSASIQLTIASALGVAVETAWTICAIFKFTTAGDGTVFVIGNNSSDGAGIYKGAGLRGVNYPGVGSWLGSAATQVDEIWVAKAATSGTPILLVNNAGDTLSGGAAPAAAASASTRLFNGRLALYEIFVYDTKISDANSTLAYNYLHARYGV